MRLGPAVFQHDHGNWEDDYRAEVPALHDPDHDRFITLAEDDRHVLGYVGWNVTDGDSGRLEMVAVHPDARRRGVASALCATVLDRLRARGVSVVHIGTGGDEFHAPARRLYESQGFTAYPGVEYTKALFLTGSAMPAARAVGVVRGLLEAGVRIWVMGGWGIDALLNRETRPHHDLDLMVAVDDLPVLTGWLQQHGFERTRVWQENRPVRVAGVRYDTAFVERHNDGREIDVHAILLDGHSPARLATADPWELPRDFLSGTGTIHGQRVDCVTREAQLMMHSGYDLPEHQRDDLRALRDEKCPQQDRPPTHAVEGLQPRRKT